MEKIEIECEVGKVSDGYHTFEDLYEHRHVLLMALMMSNSGLSWKSRKHSDGSDAYEGWFLAGMTLPTGQITYHLPNRLFDMLEVSDLTLPPEYDGHIPAEVIIRLGRFVRGLGNKGENNEQPRD